MTSPQTQAERNALETVTAVLNTDTSDRLTAIEYIRVGGESRCRTELRGFRVHVITYRSTPRWFRSAC